MTVRDSHEYIILSLRQLPQSASQSIHWRCIRYANLQKLLASDCNFASLITAQVISCNLLIPFLTFCYIIIYYLFLFQTIRYTRIQYLAIRNLYSTNQKTPSTGLSISQFSVAEREGFEPSVRFLVHTRSRRAPSTTRSPLHGAIIS